MKNTLLLINTASQIRNVLLFCTIIVIMGCGGSKTVVTQDDSADYHSARSLPPLKKPSRQTATQTSIPTSVEASVSDAASTVVLPSSPTSKPTTMPTAGSASENSDADDLAQELNNYTPDQASNAQVVEAEENIARLQIDGGFDSAWNYVSDNLMRSNITVHNRNQTAGRFAIGCADMDDADHVVKRGGWLIFSRQAKQTEHCSLQLISDKSTTSVSVLNRSGNEVAAISARGLFTRLLNN